MRTTIISMIFVVACTARATQAAAPDVIIFGGGWGPEGTQASIEQHVAALSKSLAASRPTVLFAAGSTKLPAVQERATKTDPVSELLGQLFDRRGDLHVRYRPTSIDAGAGATRSSLLAALKTAGRRQPTIVFGAGHGAKATEGKPATLELWGPDDRVDAQAIAQGIKGQKHPVAFVLGQCHSGAMAQLAFDDANPKSSLAAPARCVLAAVPADREASGCTADINDPSAPAYLAQIAKAFAGKTADYNANGRVSLEEAHAFATIHDPTVDVPVRSSELYVEFILGDLTPDPQAMPLATITKQATSSEQAILRATLPETLRGKAPKDVADRLAKLDEQIERAGRALDEAVLAKDLARRALVDVVLLKWPELANPYHHRSRQLLAGDAAEVVAFIEKHPARLALTKKEAIVGELDQTMAALERRAARIERWIRTAQLVVGRAVINQGKDAKAKAGLASLIRCERLEPKL